MNYEVKVDVSTVYELMGSFMVFISKKWTHNLDIGPEWVREVEIQLGPDIASILAPAASWPFTDYDVLYVWAVKRTTSDGIQEFLNHLRDCEAQELFQSASRYIPHLTIEDVNRIRDHYTPLLTLWYEHYFKSVEDDILTLLEEDAEEKQLLLSKMDAEDLVEYASGGLVVHDIPDLKTVILFPTVHIRPINTYSFYTSMLLIQYPVDVPEENEDDPPTVLTRMTHALSDSKRLRLLRYVGDSPKSLNDMKRDLGLTEEMLKHHLMILRVAGLLRIHLGDHHNEKFSIRAEGASELQMFLESYIRL